MVMTSLSKASREDAEFKGRYEIKTQMAGEAADLDKQLPHQVKEVTKALGLEGASPSSPNARSGGQGETRIEETTMFRAVDGDAELHVPMTGPSSPSLP